MKRRAKAISDKDRLEALMAWTKDAGNLFLRWDGKYWCDVAPSRQAIDAAIRQQKRGGRK